MTGTFEGAPIQARDLAMGEFALAAPSIPIPFHRLLKVVALVDRENAQTRQLLDRIAEEKFEIEVSERYDRDVSEDADVGAYIISIDGDRREPARNLGRAVRAIGFRTPIWALADSHRVADVAV
ncbi:MAG TPA: Orn/Lys/Arg decarboxylase N-terminal domain-containing protein, partial [Actinomycetota bacterium]|nr:Orn/Lys/Arg decarboxylase N-terminal domain-containing protein [Actinomycetota bacterium]